MSKMKLGYFLEYPIGILESNRCLIVVSIAKGWGILKTADQLNTACLINSICGFLREWRIFVRFKGIGIRHSVVRNKSIGVVKVGSSHKLTYCRFKSTRLTSLKRHLVIIRSRDVYFFKRCIFDLISKFKRSVYKKKGVFFKGSTFKLKKSRKKSRF